MPDTTPPVLTGLSFPTFVNLAKTDLPFTFTASAVDDQSGVAEVKLDFVPWLLTVSGPGATEATTSLTIGANGPDTFADGSASATVMLSKYATVAPGANVIATVTDKAGNSRVYDYADLVAIGSSGSFEIRGGIPDTTLPVLTAFELPTALDLMYGPKKLNIRVGAVDDTGIAGAYLIFDKPLTVEHGPTLVQAESMLSVDGTDDQFATGSAALSSSLVMPAIDSGIYTVSELVIQDIAGNYRTYTTAALRALGYATQINVRGPGPDTAGPQVVSFGPGLIDLAAHATSVPFTLSAADAVGIYEATVYFDRPLAVVRDGLTSTIDRLAFSSFFDPFTDGRSIVPMVLSPYALPGTYKIARVELFDRLGNYAEYDAADLAKLPGGTPSFEVRGGAPNTPPTLVDLGLPAAIDVASIADVGFFATASDAETAVASVEIVFDKPFLGLGQEKQWSLTYQGKELGFGRKFFSLYNHPMTLTVETATVTDATGHKRVYAGAELDELGIDRSVAIVGGVNVLPHVPEHSFVVSEGSSITGNLLEEASDQNRDAIVVTSVNGKPVGTPTPTRYGTITAKADGSFKLVADRAEALSAAYVGDEELTFTVSDGFGSKKYKAWIRVNGDAWIEGTPGNDKLVAGGIMYGYAGNDYLDGDSGDDLLIGGLGNDTYVVHSNDARVREKANQGQDTIVVRSHLGFRLSAGSAVETLKAADGNGYVIDGNDLAQTILGGGGRDTLNGRGGNDVLVGGAGADELTGGAGRDDFRFDVRPRAGFADIIHDFSVRDDTVQLERADFRALGPAGPLPGGAFVRGRAAQDQDDRLIYDRGSGRLYYDSDGTGSAAKVEIAKLAKGLALTATDFFVI